jgi:hypothetical protein
VAVSISQNFTSPAVKGLPFEVTVAVNVRIVPADTDAPGDRLKVVTVGLVALHTGAQATSIVASTVNHFVAELNVRLARAPDDLP